MPKPLALFFSFIFHPVMLPAYAFIVTYYTNPYLFADLNHQAVIQIFLRLIINTILFPVIAILLLKGLGLVKSIYMPEGRERIAPYVACGLFYIWTFVVFHNTNVPGILSIILLGSCITLFVVFFINIFKKISIHAAGMGCFIGLMLGLAVISPFNIYWLVMITVFAAGIVGTSRLSLLAHEPNEVYLGYFVGLMAQLVAFNFL